MGHRLITKGSFHPFEDLIDGDFVYVDKTALACDLAKEHAAYLLTRPRRMGKSTFLSTLKHLFMNGTQGCEGLDCFKKWSDPWRYFVFNFSWNNLNPSSAEDLRSSIVSSLTSYTDYFGITLPADRKFGDILKFFFRECVNKLCDETFLKEHRELSDGDRPFNPQKIVLLIDEYDAPLTNHLGNPLVFEELRQVYTELFSTIEDLNFRFVFITGITSYAQSSIFSSANQFINLSLDPRFATCCGYTLSEIEHYFVPELHHACEVLNISHESLIRQLRFHYAGYLFSDEANEDHAHIRVFSPVSVSMFLSAPQRTFRPYWSITGAASALLFHMLSLCSSKITKLLIDKVFDTENMQAQEHQELEEHQGLEAYLDSRFPFFCLDIGESEHVNDGTEHLLELNISDLSLLISSVESINAYNAILFLLQSGYLSIKTVKGCTAYLVITNYEVAYTLAYLLTQTFDEDTKTENCHDKRFIKAFNQDDSVFSVLHRGGMDLVKFIDSWLSDAPWEFFLSTAQDNQITSLFYLELLNLRVPTQRKVYLAKDRAAIVIYKEVDDKNVIDTVIEFQIAKQEDSILDKLQDGAVQLIERRYDLNVSTTDTNRYCVVISTKLRQVGALAKIDSNDKHIIIYQSPLFKGDGSRTNSKTMERR